ncbi:hypothetical protein [Halalkaliarchaeum desulfuricum]|nr:hypothetical protein [Halalkaliarchaeum desulfuricum]
MKRRSVLRALGSGSGIGVFGSTTVVGRNNSGSNPVIRGRIQRPDNRPQTEHVVFLDIKPDGGQNRYYEIIELGPSGRFEHALTEPSQVRIVYWGLSGKSITERDGIPDLYYIKDVSVGPRPLNVGNLQLPEGHVLNVKVENKAGDPVEGAGVRVATCLAAECESWYGSGRHETNEDGMFVFGGADKPGIEVSGPVYTNVYHPDGEWEWRTHLDSAELYVDEPTEHVFEIEL